MRRDQDVVEVHEIKSKKYKKKHNTQKLKRKKKIITFVIEDDKTRLQTHAYFTVLLVTNHSFSICRS